MGKKSKGRLVQRIQEMKRGQESRRKKVIAAGAEAGVGIKKNHKKNELKGFKNQQQQQHYHRLIPFEKNDKILLIGEGDFSYAVSLIIDHGVCGSQITATSYDESIQELIKKYPQTIEKNLSILQENQVRVLYAIDGTKLSGYKQIKSGGPYDRVMFHFPHKGNSISSQDHNIRQHQILIRDFFNSITVAGNNKIIHSKSKIVVSLFQGAPYDDWNIKKLAKYQSVPLSLETSGSFQWDLFPSYNHRLTSGGTGDTNKPYKTRKARTYIFQLASANKQNSNQDNKNNSDDDDDDID